MNFSHKLDHVKPSATLAINARTLDLKAQGIDIISLAVGEPDFPTPPHICAAAKAAIDAGHTRYTPVAGIQPLRHAVCTYFGQQFGVALKEENVIITNGGKQSLFNMFQVLLNEGDEVLIPAPYWVSYPDMAYLAGGTPVTVPSSATQGFKITPAMLDQYQTPRTRLLMLNSPANPTGTVYTQQELDALILWAVERDIFVITDEIYNQLVYAPCTAASALPLWQKYPQKIAICNGVAKSFAMTGWRVGYTITDAEIIKKCTTVQGQSTSNICTISQYAAIAALEGPLDCLTDMRVAFQRRRDMACEIIRQWDKAHCPVPGGTFYLFVDVHKYFTPQVPDDVALCKLLLDKAHVATVPGSAFGDGNCIRLSYATSDTMLEQALQCIGAELKKL